MPGFWSKVWHVSFLVFVGLGQSYTKWPFPHFKHFSWGLHLWLSTLHSTILGDFELWIEHHLDELRVNLCHEVSIFFRKTVYYEQSFLFISSFAIWNACDMLVGCFWMTHLAIFSLNDWDKKRSIFKFVLHCSAVVPQLCNNSSPYLQMNKVRLSLLHCLKLTSERLAVVNLENSVPIFSLREFHDTFCNGME